jgi:hypothetical protein
MMGHISVLKSFGTFGAVWVARRPSNSQINILDLQVPTTREASMDRDGTCGRAVQHVFKRSKQVVNHIVIVAHDDFPVGWVLF